MESNITLKIKDPNLRIEYYEKRSKEIMAMSSLVAALVIVVNFIVAIISIFKKWDEYILELWLGRILGIAINVILLFFQYKYPVRMAPFHGPILVVSQLGFFIYGHGDISKGILPRNAMPASIAGLFSSMIFGILCNANWLVTAGSVIFTVIFTMTYYSIIFNFIDFVTISVIGNNMIFLFIALYKIEKRDKTDILQYAQIRQMNEELKQILMNLPEGIILINDETDEVALQNQEFNRIFSIPEDAPHQDIKQLIRCPTVKLYNDGGNPNDLRTENNISQIGEDGLDQISIMQASASPEGMLFRVLQRNLFQQDYGDNQRSINNAQEIITFKQQRILFQNSPHRMIMIKSITHFIKYQKLKMQNHFLEMLTATVSHDLRTPLNAILGMGKNLESYIFQRQGGLAKKQESPLRKATGPSSSLNQAQAKRYFRIMMNSANLMQFLVNDLIDLFRIRNGKFIPIENRVTLRDHLEDLIEVFELQTQEKGLTLRLDWDSQTLPHILTLDVQRVKQILINLLGNALKFTFNGHISLQATVSFDSPDGSPRLQLLVRDTGIGIRPEDKDKIFQMLGKLEATASINTSGVGLGLSTCKKIAQALKGDIRLIEDEEEMISLLPTKSDIKSSQKGTKQQGTAIALILSCPEIDEKYRGFRKTNFESIQERDSQSLEQSRDNLVIDTCQFGPHDSSRQPLFDDFLDQNLPTLRATKRQAQIIGKHLPCPCEGRADILVVDDNIFNILTLQTILEQTVKMRSDRALNGQEALDLVKSRMNKDQKEPCHCEKKRSNFKLVFMDCNMPVMDGFQATIEIRKLYSNQQIHIAALTAYASESFEKRCREAGMDTFLTKPVSDDKIQKLVKQLKLSNKL